MIVKNYESNTAQIDAVIPCEGKIEGVEKFRMQATTLHARKDEVDLIKTFSISSIGDHLPVVQMNIDKVLEVMEQLIDEMNATF